MSRMFDTAMLEAATRAQRLALEPGISVWVSASAGTGKTEVLTRRLMTLLLSDARLRAKEILALTFTRAGAAEMAARLPERLGAWAKLGDEELAAVVFKELGLRGIADLGARVRGLADEVLREGPVVTTIHGLGQMLLTSFPIEAGVPMGFGVLEDGERARMLQEIQHGLLVSGEVLTEHLAVLLDELGDHGWRELTEIMVRGWRKLQGVLGEGDVRDVLERVDAGLGLRGGEEWALGPLVIQAGEVAALRAVAEGIPDKGAGEILNAGGKVRERLWREFLLTDKDTARVNVLAKKEIALVGDGVAEVFMVAKERIAEQVRLRKVLRGRKLTEALLAWGAAVRGGYAAYKSEMGMLDYDDLLEGLERLLVRAQDGLADWVWYVLDRKFRHLVVDEAQDNNPQQDRIVRMLMRNMLAGDVGDDRVRSVLAVGDVKQSIFRFQGAVPELFMDLQAEMVRWAGGNFKAVDIRHSFRSGRHVLAAVDAVFADAALATEVMGVEQDWLPHVAVAKERESRVEVWPLVAEGEKVDVGAWALPQERFEAQGDGADVKCFKAVGAWLRARMEEGVVMPSTGMRMRWEDVMVVVQRNKVAGLAAGVLRRMGIPVVVGAGVVPQMVQDVVALCRAVFEPRDHVALATVLKGICGWDDAQLLALAGRAGEGAWVAALDEVTAHWFAGFAGLSPLGVVQRGMDAVGGGAEIFEPLLGWAEEAESLAALVARLERDDLPVAAGMHGVRVLTVHGAKGLQAPLVILPDSMARMGDVQDKVLWGDDVLLVRGAKGVSNFEDALVEEESGRRRADALRGLYVAMTRASDWLVVCGWGKEGKRDSWWSLVKEAAAGWQEEGGISVLGDRFPGEGKYVEKVNKNKVPAWVHTKAARALVGGAAE